MINYSFYKDEIIAYFTSDDCCREFVFRDKTNYNGELSGIEFRNWLKAEHKYPTKLSKFAYYFLKKLYDCDYRYITLNEDLDVEFFNKEPTKQTSIGEWECFGFYKSGEVDTAVADEFSFISWEDEEPTSIKEVLENCEVIEDE